jgi:tryptophan-rich sensory protein
MAKFITLIIFVAVIQGMGALIGMSFTPGQWYEDLAKPFFNPPSYLFGIVWPVLYLLVAIAGWRVFSSEGDMPGWGLWVSQMLLNFSWSPVFFYWHQIFWAMWILIVVLVLSLSFMATNWHRDRIAAFCFVPYVAWLGFAFVLNFSIWIMN